MKHTLNGLKITALFALLVVVAKAPKCKSRAPKKRVRHGTAIMSITPRRNGVFTFKILSIS
jgi:hypothetical protein